MSRSNHYRLCHDCTAETRCKYPDWHPAFLPKEMAGRRPWKRKARFPKFAGNKRWHNPPPRWWQEQHAQARAKFRQMMQRSEDPALPRERDLINLWAWY